MHLRILNADTVRRNLPMPDAIRAVRGAYLACSSGRGAAPDRIHIPLPNNTHSKHNVALFMPGFIPANTDDPGEPTAASLVIKTVTVFPGNPSRDLAMNQGALLVVDSDTGCASALMDTATITAIRTAAGSAVGADLLARPDASSMAMLGTGVLGPTHIEAICAVRRIKHVHIWGRTERNAAALAEHATSLTGAKIEVHETADDAVRHADIVCTATPSTVPLFKDASVRPGTHISAVGAFRPTMCEIPPETIFRSRVYLDQRSSSLVEAGDIIQAVDRGVYDWDRVVGELGEVIDGSKPGRESNDDVTFFKSVGMSLQDAAAAGVALRNAERNDDGEVFAWP